jgi:cell division protein FtsI/penicillin-binding protein 2
LFSQTNRTGSRQSDARLRLSWNSPSAAAPSGKTGTAEKVVNLPGYPVGHLEDQAWWCGWGPFDGNDYVTPGGASRPPIVVCAVIENGGHGGAVAAPAALKVFEYWFREHAGVQGVVASD